MSEPLIIAGVDLSHYRLVDLVRLSDQAKPFYEWVEKQFQNMQQSPLSLNELLISGSLDDIERCLRACYMPTNHTDLPLLFDGGGRTYPHFRACYYFFAWMIRDAPQQRLSPLIQRIVKSTGKRRLDVEIEVLAALIVKYRAVVKTFAWEAVREVILERLEGSRRSIRGHEKEFIVRTAVANAVQAYYERTENYGVYAGFEISANQVVIGKETFDVCINLLDENGDTSRRILIPIKTRETEGGGHTHLFSRDLLSAINTLRSIGSQDYLMGVIIARSWSIRETENLAGFLDHMAIFPISPNEFVEFDNDSQVGLNQFMADVFAGTVLPKLQTGQS